MLTHSIKKSEVTRIAVLSRIIVFCVQLLSTYILPLHLNDGFKFQRQEEPKLLDDMIGLLFNGFTSWDGQYFLHICKNGYTDENTIAFFPLFPSIIWTISKPLEFICGFIVSFESIAVVVSFHFNSYLFVKTAQVVYDLVPYFDNCRESLRTVTVLLFCFNPASIFFSSFYSESLFAFLTFHTLLALLQRKVCKAALLTSLSTVCRSNGLLNVGFVLAFELCDILGTHKNIISLIHGVFRLINVACKQILLLAIMVAPFAGFQIFCLRRFCEPEYSLTESIPAYCLGTQLPYQYIQASNWNVGFLRYFEIKQIPNFLLAAPVLFTLGQQSIPRLVSNLRRILRTFDPSWIPLVAVGAHGAFLTAFCVSSMHVQVSTRLVLSSCPYLFIFMGEVVTTELYEFRAGMRPVMSYTLWIYGWFLLYFLGGCVAFPAGYPWT